MFERIHEERANHSIAMLCGVLGVSRSGYYRWASARPSTRAREDQRLKPVIAEVTPRAMATTAAHASTLNSPTAGSRSGAIESLG